MDCHLNINILKFHSRNKLHFDTQKQNTIENTFNSEIKIIIMDFEKKIMKNS